jgi:hypothetical protein
MQPSPCGRRARFPQGNGYNLGRFTPSFASFGMADIGTVQEGADLVPFFSAIFVLSVFN